MGFLRGGTMLLRGGAQHLFFERPPPTQMLSYALADPRTLVLVFIPLITSIYIYISLRV